ncbi:lipoprotein [Spiroplasma endosymbiont of Panorpa germanica]|uniref:lipoprotein n=1 Tax=Spiroplasma endosymbiont of Panorpa germanica TaxID=3066314 RepID=UPI0030D02F37
MRKLLNLLAGFTLTASAAGVVVSCDVKIASFDQYAPAIQAKLRGWDRDGENISKYYESGSNSFSKEMPVDTFVAAVRSVTAEIVSGSKENVHFTFEVTGDDKEDGEFTKSFYASKSEEVVPEVPETEDSIQNKASGDLFDTNFIKVTLKAVDGNGLWRGEGSFIFTLSEPK